ncbi:MAG: mechanosensitive ion channel family protein [Chromatiaceae bacterium]|nr:mechanosensitive ion channel family protein [Chromatiaceae bacterium]
MKSLGIDLPHWLPTWQHVAPSLFIYIVGATLAVLIQRILRRALARASRHTPLSAETAMVIQRLVAGTMWLLLILVTLRHMGVNVDDLWTLLLSVLAVIGVGLLAVWAMASNITANFFILIWKPYELGDRVELIPDDIRGRAVYRSLMFTILRGDEGGTLMVPNNLSFQRIIRRAPAKAHQTALERWEQERA